MPFLQKAQQYRHDVLLGLTVLVDETKPYQKEALASY